jgi:predicted amidophosphoribosyltransferase
MDDVATTGQQIQVVAQRLAEHGAAGVSSTGTPTVRRPGFR